MKYLPFPIVIGATISPFRLFSDFPVLSFLDKKNLLQTLKADSWPVFIIIIITIIPIIVVIIIITIIMTIFQ